MCEVFSHFWFSIDDYSYTVLGKGADSPDDVWKFSKNDQIKEKCEFEKKKGIKKVTVSTFIGM